VLDKVTVLSNIAVPVITSALVIVRDPDINTSPFTSSAAVGIGLLIPTR